MLFEPPPPQAASAIMPGAARPMARRFIIGIVFSSFANRFDRTDQKRRSAAMGATDLFSDARGERALPGERGGDDRVQIVALGEPVERRQDRAIVGDQDR